MAAHNRGAGVQVLVEGGRVGRGFCPKKKMPSGRSTTGITVSAMVSSKDVHAPYRYDHAKYAVIDGGRSC